MKKTITRRQRDCLEAISEITRGQGFPPTLTDIASYMNVAHRSTVHRHVSELRRMGMVGWSDGKTRTITLTDGGRAALTEG